MALANSPKTGLLVDGAPGDEHYDELMAQWRGVDMLIQPTCQGFPTSPPAASDGDIFIVGASATGAFAGHDNKFARYSDSLPGWEFIAPLEGWIAYDTVGNGVYRFDGSAWIEEVGDGGLPPGGTEGQVIAMLSGSPAWADLEPGVPSGGTDGQVLKKIAGVPAWGEDAGGPPAVVTKASDTNALVAGDANTYMRFTFSGAKSASFATGMASNLEFHIRNANTGALTLTSGGGITLNPPADGTLVLDPHMTVTVKHVGSDVFDVMGQTVPA